ncbi:hypothetical protein TSUD_354680 [Trifolium subterraneum]|uniref:Uncharacterized protein n=1 Tax=Trifolium subterraneum TaxID=3900 RepID=A0A2Z6N0M8_TRISU|nr:hypothetical protein TSUD_354680 [Trifolium subterraneum]
MDFEKIADDFSTITINNVCSTPKGQKSLIQEISTCPPAPMKQRVFSKKRNMDMDMNYVKVIDDDDDDDDVYNTNRSKILVNRRNFNMLINTKLRQSTFKFLN